MQRKLHVTILLYSMGSGGAERLTSLLLFALEQECQITLVLLEKILHYQIPSTIPIVILGTNHTQESGIKKLLKIPLLAWKYRKIIRDCDISLSLMTRPNYINVLAGFLLRLRKTRPKILISERSFPSGQYGYKNLNSALNRLLIRTLYNRADKISANSPQNLSDLIQNFGILADKTTLLLNFFDLTKIQREALEDTPLKQRILEEKKRGKFVFISIGRLDSGKNHRLMIEAMQEFKQEASLFIIGSGVLEESLKSQIVAWRLESCVFLLGRTRNPYAPLSVADCFLFTSNHEGFPNVLVESLALGIPLITTDCAPREILAPQNTFLAENSLCEIAKAGIIVPLRDKNSLQNAMHFLLQNPSYFKPSVLKSQAQTFSKEVQIPHYRDWILGNEDGET